MSDITKFKGTGCEMKDNCYRFTAKANEYRQSWFCEVPVKGKECSHYYPNVAEKKPPKKKSIISHA